MKTLCKSWLFIGLLMAFCLAACSDDDDDAVTPIFPEKQNIIATLMIQGSSLLRLIRTGVWLLLPFGVSSRQMTWKNLSCPEQPVRRQ